MEEEYYDDYDYDDYDYEGGDGGDGGAGEADETWETLLESKYVQGKSMMHTDADECIKLIKEVEAEDPHHGKWTFKALKVLARATCIAEKYDEMLSYFTRIAHFQHEDVDAPALQKAITKFIERAQRIPPQYMDKVLAIALEISGGNKQNYSKLWLDVLLRHVSSLLDQGAYTEAEKHLLEAKEWCTASEDVSTQYQGSQLCAIYSLQLRLYTETRQYALVRPVYYAVVNMKDAGMLPQRFLGRVAEYAGYMFSRDGDWSAAQQSFSLAYSYCNESGDAHRLTCLKGLVVAGMLGGSPVNPFAASDTRACADIDEMKPVVALLEAFLQDDVAGFLAILESPTQRGAIMDDPELCVYHDPLLHRLRFNCLIHYVGSFVRVPLADLSKRLVLTEEATMDLCTFAILQGVVSGSIDESAKMLELYDKMPPSELLRSEALFEWAQAVDSTPACVKLHRPR